MVVTLANVLLRLGETQTGGARQYLLDLLTAKFADINTQNGQIIATSVNGKSMTIQAVAGVDLASQLKAAELALSALERGLTRVPRQTQGVLR